MKKVKENADRPPSGDTWNEEGRPEWWKHKRVGSDPVSLQAMADALKAVFDACRKDDR